MLALLGLSSTLGCKASASNSGADGATDAGLDAGIPACSASQAGSPTGEADDFGPNAKALTAPSALGQLDVYEISSPHQLEWVDVYLRADLADTRVTISVYQALVRNGAFAKLTDVQVEAPRCVGWISSGPLAIALETGRFYAIGFDPNQAVTAFVDSESNDLPVDGRFGRLIGSKTATSVSVDTLDWGKPSDKDFTRQRLFTSPRDGSDAAAGGDPAGLDAARLDTAATGG